MNKHSEANLNYINFIAIADYLGCTRAPQNLTQFEATDNFVELITTVRLVEVSMNAAAMLTADVKLCV
jgi:hypothetical protein